MNSVACIIFVCVYLMAVNGQYVGRPRQPTLPEICLRAFCPPPRCRNPVRPKGECCLVCRPTLPERCARVSCVKPDCLNPVTPDGECCPVCPGSGSKPGRCPRRSRNIFGACVHECVSDYSCPGNQKCCNIGCRRTCVRPRGRCGRIQCPQLRCANQYIPPGECCPVCRPIKPDCSRIACTQQFCQGQYTPEGQCCPVCPNTAY